MESAPPPGHQVRLTEKRKEVRVTGTLRVIQPRDRWAKGDSSAQNGRGQIESPGPGTSRTAQGTNRAGSRLGTGEKAHVLPRASSKISSYCFLTQQVKIKSLLLGLPWWRGG